ncbi:MAG: VanW family protein [Eggerthellaceae bacterium]
MPTKRRNSPLGSRGGNKGPDQSPARNRKRHHSAQGSSQSRSGNAASDSFSREGSTRPVLRSSARIEQIRQRASEDDRSQADSKSTTRRASNAKTAKAPTQRSRVNRAESSADLRTSSSSSAKRVNGKKPTSTKTPGPSRSVKKTDGKPITRQPVSRKRISAQADRNSTLKGKAKKNQEPTIGQKELAGGIWSKHDKRSASRKAQASSGAAAKNGKASRGAYSRSKPSHSARSRKPILIAVLCLALVGALGYGIDSALNGNKIYSGVVVGDVNVGGMTREEATDSISAYYSPRVAENVAVFYASAEDEQDPQSNEQAESIEEQISYEESLETRTQWTLPANKLDTTLNIDELVEQAFQVGRNTGGIIGRLQAQFNSWSIEPVCTFNETSLGETLKEMTAAVGNERVNFNIEMTDGIASVTEGNDGNEVVREWLVSRLNSAYLGDGSALSYVLETQYLPLQIDEEKARSCADSINASIAAGVHFVFEDQTWDATRDDIAGWITTNVTRQGNDWVLKPLFDESAAKNALLTSLRSNIDRNNLELTFNKDDQGTITVSSNAVGTVPLVSEALRQMNDSFFVTQSRTEAPQITLDSTEIPSSLSFDDARDYGLISEISSFTTQYSSGAEARTNNIHTAADLLNNSIIKANGGSWSFNDTAGEATEDKGYQNAGAIVGGEYSDAIGGGICQVATTVFNSIYDAGYPITERHNHTLHIESYPKGRDAAIAYPYMDLVWQNDSSSDVLLVMTYTNSSVTASLWGIDPGYQVSTDYGEWKKGEAYSVIYKTDKTIASGKEYVETTGVDGSSISIVRCVKDSSGNILHEDVFESNYQPKDQVIVKGTA